MPATERHVESALGEIDLMKPEQAIRAQAYYMMTLHRGNWTGKLWLTYCFYNSGPGTMKKEAARAGISEYAAMRAVCKRRVLQLKNGLLDLCDVGYDYPRKVHKYGLAYAIGNDGISFW